MTRLYVWLGDEGELELVGGGPRVLPKQAVLSCTEPWRMRPMLFRDADAGPEHPAEHVTLALLVGTSKTGGNADSFHAFYSLLDLLGFEVLEDNEGVFVETDRGQNERPGFFQRLFGGEATTQPPNADRTDEPRWRAYYLKRGWFDPEAAYPDFAARFPTELNGLQSKNSFDFTKDDVGLANDGLWFLGSSTTTLKFEGVQPGPNARPVKFWLTRRLSHAEVAQQGVGVFPLRDGLPLELSYLGEDVTKGVLRANGLDVGRLGESFPLPGDIWLPLVDPDPWAWLRLTATPTENNGGQETGSHRVVLEVDITGGGSYEHRLPASSTSRAVFRWATVLLRITRAGLEVRSPWLEPNSQLKVLFETSVLVWQVDGAAGSATTVTTLSSDSQIASLSLSPSFDDSRVLVAAGLQTGETVLWDVWDSAGTSPGSAPSTRWVSETQTNAPVHVAVAWTPDGPRLLGAVQSAASAATVSVPDHVLRLGQEHLVTFQLPAELHGDLLDAAITPGRNLDLSVNLSTVFGFDQPLHTVAVLTQGLYHGFVVEAYETAVHDPHGRARRGSLVVWEEGDFPDADLNGVLVVEDSAPSAVAKLKFPDNSELGLTGRRIRMRILSFHFHRGAEPDYLAREVLSWSLQADGNRVELLLNEQVLPLPPSADSDGPPHLVSSFFFQGLAGAAGAIQGSLLVEMQIKPRDDEYELSIPSALYYAEPVEKVNAAAFSPFGTTRNDIVLPRLPTGPGDPLGESLDLIEVARLGLHRTSRSTRNGDLAGGFVTVVGNVDGTIDFKKVSEDYAPVNLTLNPAAYRKMPKSPVQVPQLVHRRSQGGRLRSGRPATMKHVRSPDTTGDAFSPRENQWMVFPLIDFGDGAGVYFENVAAQGRQDLVWERLQTESLLNVQRRGESLLGERPGTVSLAESSASQVSASRSVCLWNWVGRIQHSERRALGPGRRSRRRASRRDLCLLRRR